MDDDFERYFLNYMEIFNEETNHSFNHNSYESISQSSSFTGLNNQEQFENSQQPGQNNNEAIPNNSAQNEGSIAINNNQRNQMTPLGLNNTENASTEEKTNKKKRGRREKGTTLTGGHTGDYPGNKLRKNGTASMDSLITCLNLRCKIYNSKLRLKKVNFAKQFGYNKDNKYFIKQRLYKILRYKSEHNQKVIEKMTKVHKDQIFMFIINFTFENFYEKYVLEENTICFDETEIHYNCFETLNEIADKKEKSNEFKENWTKNDFIESSKQFLNEVNGKGKLINRSRRMPNIALCEYEVVKEIENFFEGNSY